MKNNKKEFSDGACCESCAGGHGCESGKVFFTDDAVFRDGQNVISLRDGVYQYLGAEIGQQPATKLFDVYRSAEEVQKLNDAMVGIAVTDGHVNISQDVPEEKTVSKILASDVVEFVDEATSSTVALKNRLELSDSMVELKEDGVEQFSLGFRAELVPSENFDFEQKGFEPHHLALLEKGRCGDSCKFVDGKPEEKGTLMSKLGKLLKTFKDQEGDVTLQQIMEMVSALPEAMKNVPMEELSKLAEPLKQLIDVAKEAGLEIQQEATEEEAVEEVAEESSDEEVTEENTDEETSEEESEDTGEEVEDTSEEMEDEESSEEEKREMADGVVLFSDHQVKELTEAAIKEHSDVIEHARQFVDQDYDFKGKTTDQIRSEVVAMHTDQEFTDSGEIAIAFKMLQTVSSKYKGFADGGKSKFDELKEKEL